jgi:hypothetical protein
MEAEISRIQLETLEKTHNNLGSVNTLLVLLSGIIAVTLAKGVGIFAYIHDTAIDLILGALIFLGGIIIGGTVVIKIYKFMVRNEESSRIGAVKATYEKAVEAATKRSEKAIEAAIKRVEIVSPALEESIRLLEAHREKAEKALGWLKAQA